MSALQLKNKNHLINDWICKNNTPDDELYVQPVYNDTPHYIIALRQYRLDSPTCINVYTECIKGICTYSHYINDCKSQMLPCHTFVELLLRGDIDPDWQYILRGVVFGFRIINPDCSVTYSAKPKKINSEIFRNIIDKKIIKEIEDGKISTVVYAWYILCP